MTDIFKWAWNNQTFWMIIALIGFFLIGRNIYISWRRDKSLNETNNAKKEDRLISAPIIDKKECSLADALTFKSKEIDSLIAECEVWYKFGYSIERIIQDTLVQFKKERVPEEWTLEFIDKLTRRIQEVKKEK